MAWFIFLLALVFGEILRCHLLLFSRGPSVLLVLGPGSGAGDCMSSWGAARVSGGVLILVSVEAGYPRGLLVLYLYPMMVYLAGGDRSGMTSLVSDPETLHEIDLLPDLRGLGDLGGVLGFGTACGLVPIL